MNLYGSLQNAITKKAFYMEYSHSWQLFSQDESESATIKSSASMNISASHFKAKQILSPTC